MDEQLKTAAMYLLQMRSLKRVTVPDDAQLMTMVARRGGWEQVGVLIRGSEGLQVARQGLEGVARVKVICGTGIAGDVCGMQVLEGLEGIEVLHVECGVGGRHYGLGGMDEQVWRGALKDVREVSFVGGVPEGARWCLGGVERVWVDGVGALQVGVECGKRCKRIVCDEVLEGVGALEECADLEEFGVGMRGGVEISLGKVIENMRELRVLRLGWKVEGTYWRMEEGWLERLVGRLRHLEGLYLKGVVIEGSELEQVLIRIGMQLTGLEVPLVGQDESVLQRLERVLVTLSRFNGELRQFGVTGEKDAIGMFDSEEVANVGRRVFQAMQRLKWRAPMWRAAQLEYFVRCRLLGMGDLMMALYEESGKMNQKGTTWVRPEVLKRGVPWMDCSAVVELA